MFFGQWMRGRRDSGGSKAVSALFRRANSSPQRGANMGGAPPCAPYCFRLTQRHGDSKTRRMFFFPAERRIHLRQGFLLR